jgi:hypothetical protein
MKFCNVTGAITGGTCCNLGAIQRLHREVD